MSSPVIPNPYNAKLSEKHASLQRALRYAMATVCDPFTRKPESPANLRKQLKTIQINATLAGDNIVIPTLNGVRQIFELVMWNVGAQTCLWQQGTTGGMPITLLDLVNFPALTGFLLGFNGNFEQPHWEIDNGQALVLNLSAGTQVTGFIRYRTENGTH